ncbi:hypothetical protein [Microcoleus sp. B7-D4]|uniref:hypothetical protein n=1 Tax=Microcoleus sp. B7-D4 TaxID=2818696 RepID=UPI002FD74261
MKVITFNVDAQGRRHSPSDTEPAIVGEGGGYFYYLHGKAHRISGPAKQYPDGSVEFAIQGIVLSEKNHKAVVAEAKARNIDLNQEYSEEMNALLTPYSIFPKKRVFNITLDA